MRGPVVKAVALLVAVLVLGAPVAADDFTGSEKELRTLNCKGPYPSNQEPPGPGECTGTATTYKGYVWTNNVKCKGGQAADVQGVKIYTQQSGSGGAVGTCNDGSGAVGSQVVQGRIVASGSTNGGTVYADGDKDNTQHSTLQGWARADVSPAAGLINVRCGDDNGRKDATEYTSADTQADCG